MELYIAVSPGVADWCKPGVTRDADKRIKEIRHSHASDAELYCVFSGLNRKVAFRLEASLLKALCVDKNCGSKEIINKPPGEVAFLLNALCLVADEDELCTIRFYPEFVRRFPEHEIWQDSGIV